MSDGIDRAMLALAVDQMIEQGENGEQIIAAIDDHISTAVNAKQSAVWAAIHAHDELLANTIRESCDFAKGATQ